MDLSGFKMSTFVFLGKWSSSEYFYISAWECGCSTGVTVKNEKHAFDTFFAKHVKYFKGIVQPKT